MGIIPTFYLFDRQGQKLATMLAFAGNIVLTLVHLQWCFPKDKSEFTFSVYEMKVSLVCAIATMSVDLLFLMYLNNLSGKVYEDVKAANEATEAAAKEKEAFFATISHEIRNPLQSLQGSVELLGDMKTASELRKEKRQLIEICKSCCALVINMVSNILDMSKIAAGKMQLCPAPADLRELVRRILQVSRGRAEGKEVRLELDCDPSLPAAIEVDAQRVEQILINLVSNAIKFTPSKGRVVVKIGWLGLGPDSASQDQDSEVRIALSESSWRQTMELEEEEDQEEDHAISRRGGHHRHVLDERYQCERAPSARKKKHRGSVPPAFRAAADGLRQHQHVPTGALPRPQHSAGVVKIEVMDTGIGVSKEAALRLFRPYQQANSGISRYCSDSHRFT